MMQHYSQETYFSKKLSASYLTGMYHHESLKYEVIDRNIYVDMLEPKVSKKKSTVCSNYKDDHCDPISCNNFRRRILCYNCGPKCQNKPVQFADFLSVEDMKLKYNNEIGFHLATKVDIEPNRSIMEYTGEIVNKKKYDERASKDPSIYYGYKIHDGYFLDPRFKGNLARFMMHSCEPNCYVHFLYLRGKRRLFVITKRAITAGENLAIAYNQDSPLQDLQFECKCKAANCVSKQTAAPKEKTPINSDDDADEPSDNNNSDIDDATGPSDNNNSDIDEPIENKGRCTSPPSDDPSEGSEYKPPPSGGSGRSSSSSRRSRSVPLPAKSAATTEAITPPGPFDIDFLSKLQDFTSSRRKKQPRFGVAEDGRIMILPLGVLPAGIEWPVYHGCKEWVCPSLYYNPLSARIHHSREHSNEADRTCVHCNFVYTSMFTRNAHEADCTGKTRDRYNTTRTKVTEYNRKLLLQPSTPMDLSTSTANSTVNTASREMPTQEATIDAGNLPTQPVLVEQSTAGTLPVRRSGRKRKQVASKSAAKAQPEAKQDESESKPDIKFIPMQLAEDMLAKRNKKRTVEVIQID